jgi:uncharacterized protein (DUF302 family)
MRKLFTCLVLYILMASPAFADNGLVSVKSAHDVKTTADRLESKLKEKGMRVFNRINHAQGAQTAGISLRPTELVIFGNPKVGAPFMQCGQSVAIDLPQKALIWQDASGQVWLTYNDPGYIAGRHGIASCGQVINKISGALGNFAKFAVMP